MSRLVAFLSEKSPRAADRAASVLAGAIRSLDRFSERGRRGPADGLRELIVPFGRDAYIVQYRVEPARVVVARIFPGAKSAEFSQIHPDRFPDPTG
ncbi:MAG: type II toxin-antitoxin system RelE/ParE family toxin [Pseudomonadota bacterium]|nr:type II toxin-antitoxin system RelE/ParE family toxin [Pseudomonadota bacterium]